MKLFRFELKEEPGTARSGMVYGGKIYETDGANAVAVHEAEDVRPLPPLPHPASLRFFRSDLQPASVSEEDAPTYFYGNSFSLVGASTIIELPDVSVHWEAESYVAAVIGESTYQALDYDEADSIILGVTLITMLVARDIERNEFRNGLGYGRSYDLAGTIGPVITTPEELEEHVTDSEFGKRYALEARVKVNAVETESANIEALPITFAQAIAAASRTGPLKVGDVIALGPVLSPTSALSGGDEVIFSVEKLGALATHVTE